MVALETLGNRSGRDYTNILSVKQLHNYSVVWGFCTKSLLANNGCAKASHNSETWLE